MRKYFFLLFDKLNLSNRTNPDRHRKSVGVISLLSAYQILCKWTVEDAGPYKERLNLLMRSPLSLLFFILIFGLIS